MNTGVYEDSSSLYSDKWVFLAHSAALEQEAAERMYELAEAMAVHNNRELHELLTALATYSESHAADIKTLCKDETLPNFKAWEYSWPDDESPEIFHYAKVHYLMTAEDALQTALEVELSAEAFYTDIALSTENPEIKQLAGAFAKEEQEHAQAISDRLRAIKTVSYPGSLKDLDQTDFDPPHMPE
ncbi:MAG: ferritin family protein [Porticoccaceae bacterium]|nr:ferritin family protein [Porticoccaceae bacterium]